MSVADGERIAPVTYLFGARPVETGEGEIDRSPSAPAFVDLAAPDGAEPDVAVVDVAVAEEPRAARPSKGSFDRISNVSMYALARRGMSSREMKDYLLGREFEDVAVEEEIARLEGVALLDDVALAQTLARTLRERKNLGKSAVTAELRRRHLDGAAIEETMAELADDELDRATEVAVRRAPQLLSLDNETAKRRLGAFLMRKGYSGSVVSAAVQRALAPAGGPTFR